MSMSNWQLLTKDTAKKACMISDKLAYSDHNYFFALVNSSGIQGDAFIAILFDQQYPIAQIYLRHINDDLMGILIEEDCSILEIDGDGTFLRLNRQEIKETAQVLLDYSEIFEVANQRNTPSFEVISDISQLNIEIEPFWQTVIEKSKSIHYRQIYFPPSIQQENTIINLSEQQSFEGISIAVYTLDESITNYSTLERKSSGKLILDKKGMQDLAKLLLAYNNQ